MRRILQALAGAAALWAIGLLVLSPHIDYDDFEVECTAVLGTGNASDDLANGIEPGWSIDRGVATFEDPTLAPTDAEVPRETYQVGDACNARRTRWTGVAVVLSLLVTGLLRLAVAAPPPAAPTARPPGRKRGSPLAPEF